MGLSSCRNIIILNGSEHGLHTTRATYGNFHTKPPSIGPALPPSLPTYLPTCTYLPTYLPTYLHTYMYLPTLPTCLIVCSPPVTEAMA